MINVIVAMMFERLRPEGTTVGHEVRDMSLQIAQRRYLRVLTLHGIWKENLNDVDKSSFHKSNV
jgi:endonuclease V-like protein UPF0215 family